MYNGERESAQCAWSRRHLQWKRMWVGVGDTPVAYNGKERRAPLGTGGEGERMIHKEVSNGLETLVRHTTIGKRERQ